MKLTIVGNILLNSCSGYSVHCRELCKALAKTEGVELNIENVNYSPEQAQFVPKELQGNFNLPNFKPDATILILTPDVWPYFYLNKEQRGKLIGFGVFEGDRVPTDWRIKANHPAIDMIFYPSEHAKAAFENAGVRKPSAIIPHGMNPEIFKAQGPKLEPFASSNKFKFLYVGGWVDGERDRKGLDIALKAFCEEFQGEDKDKAEFIAKINMSYGPDPATLQRNIESVIAPFPKETRGDIHILGDMFPDETLAALYRTANIFVAPTKADAFHLGCLEALACGTPVITTLYGGQAEYVNEHNGWLLDIVGMAPATAGLTYEETQWSIPDKDQLRKLMREAYTDKDATLQKGAQGAADAQDYTWEISSEKALNTIRELLGSD